MRLCLWCLMICQAPGLTRFTEAATITVPQGSTLTTVSLVSMNGKYVFVATVTPVPPAAGTPTGTVQFFDPRPAVGAIGKANLVNGSGSLPSPYSYFVINGIVPSPGAPVTAVYSGDVNFRSSTSAPLLQVTSAAADLEATFAPDEAISLFHVIGLSGDTPAQLPLATSLGGVTVTIADGVGSSREAQLYGVFASTGQINLLIPGDVALGIGSISVTLPGVPTLSTLISIARTTPSIFTANRNGQGVYAGQVVHVHADGSQTVDSPAKVDIETASFIPKPIDLGPATDQVFLVLYGTGIRHSWGAEVFAFLTRADATFAIGPLPTGPVLFAPQGQFPGLDQVNIQIPPNLAGAGTVYIAINTAIASSRFGESLLIAANPVTAVFQ